MYKRPARVLFLAEHGLLLGQWVSELAKEQHADFLHARSAALAPRAPTDALAEVRTTNGVEVHPSRQPVICQGDIDWADLIVTLDEPARRHVAHHLPGKPTKHWSLPSAEKCGTETLLNEITDRLRSMVGGMRMLARLDSGEGGVVPP